jgi:kynureninase
VGAYRQLLVSGVVKDCSKLGVLGTVSPMAMVSGSWFDEATRLDRDDPLAHCRDWFVIDDPTLAYLDGNSLGRLPKRTVTALNETVTNDWGRTLIHSWEQWMDWPTEIGDRIGELIGAEPGEVVVSDSTTVNVFKLMASAVEARRGRTVIVMSRNDFPTNRYVGEEIAYASGMSIRWIDGDAVGGVQTEEVVTALNDDVAFVALSHVEYRSGAISDMAAITAAAHDAGALTIWDLSHSTGAVEVDLAACGAAMAVGCSYKYLNGGPGAPAYLYVRRDLQEELEPAIPGWMSAVDVFAMAAKYEPAPGIRRFLTGTPSVLALSAVRAGVSTVADAGMAAIRAKGLELGAFLVRAHDAHLAPHGVTLGSPASSAARGSHVSLLHPRALELCDALRQRSVIVDFRNPDSMRIGMSPLTTSFADVWRAVSALRDVLGD